MDFVMMTSNAIQPNYAYNTDDVQVIVAVGS